MKKTTILFILICSVLNTYAQKNSCKKAAVSLLKMPPCEHSDYFLVFEDNFDGDTLDITKWFPFMGVPRDFTFNSQKAWHLPENLEVSNGTLKIISKKLTTPYVGNWVTDYSTNPPTTKTSSFDYTTGELWTKETFFYGKYEIRCRVPVGKGFWPAFWTFGVPGWNEIDFFEIGGADIKTFTCNIHGDHGKRGEHYHCPYKLKKRSFDFSQWHIFTCFFEFDRIIWQIDGKTVRVLPRYSTKSGKSVYCGDEVSQGVYYELKSYPLQPMSIIMNTAIQTGKKAPDAKTVFPNIYEVDYVRYYMKGSP